MKLFDRFTVYCRFLVKSRLFNNFIMMVILLAGVVVGIQTYGEMVADWKPLLYLIDKAILAIFIFEVFIRMSAEGRKPWMYFGDPWNVFDFVIVTVGIAAILMPEINGAFVAVFRLARVMRVFRLVRTIPRLQLLVNVLLKSIPSIGHVAILMSIIFYIYATMGVFLFGVNDPVHFGTLQLSFLSLFRVVTLEDWTDIMYINMYGCDHEIWGYSAASGCVNAEPSGMVATIFFVTFVLVGTMVMLNLFIGVIINSMEEAKLDVQRDREMRRSAKPALTAEDELARLSMRLDEMQKELQFTMYRLGKTRKKDE
ncbi:MAG: ion transporter [Balneolales bacterium]|nr:ion transporter [Balneolales bacterium]